MIGVFVSTSLWLFLTDGNRFTKEVWNIFLKMWYIYSFVNCKDSTVKHFFIKHRIPTRNSQFFSCPMVVQPLSWLVVTMQAWSCKFCLSVDSMRLTPSKTARTCLWILSTQIHLFISKASTCLIMWTLEVACFYRAPKLWAWNYPSIHRGLGKRYETQPQ